MRGLRAVLAGGLLLAAALFAVAEVALDEVVQAGRFVLYRDHADPHKYYYVPDEPRLATKRDGTPEFTFIKYSKTDGTTKGGIIHFLVTWGLTEGELSSAESALRLKDPEAKVAGPVPFKEGTFKVVSATAGEGGIFSRRIVGEGKAPIMPGQKAAVSIALTEEGASLLWESFKNPTSDISVMFALKFTGVTPAFQAKLKVDWDKVYTQHDVKLHVEGQIKVVKLEADVRAILEELRQTGAVQLDVVGENENMQKMLDAVYTHLLSLMCEKVPMGPGEATSPATKTQPTDKKQPPAKKRPATGFITDWSGGYPAWSMGILADLVRSTEERLRGGPFRDPEQAKSASQPVCPPDQKKISDEQRADGDKLLANEFCLDAISLYKKAYESCPDPDILFQIALVYHIYLNDHENAQTSWEAFIPEAEAKGFLPGRTPEFAREKLAELEMSTAHFDKGVSYYMQKKWQPAVDEFVAALNFFPTLNIIYNIARCYEQLQDLDTAVSYLDTWLLWWRPELIYLTEGTDAAAVERKKKNLEAKIEAASGKAVEESTEVKERRPGDKTPKVDPRKAQIETVEKEIGEAGPPKTEGAQAGAQQTTSTGTAATGTKPPLTAGAGTKPTGQDLTAGGQTQQQTTSQPGAKPPTGQKPPTKPFGGQAPGAKAGTKPEAAIKPIVSVQIGYSFKRIKLSGKYEVDMRKRLREDREIPMSGNIGGLYQKYGEDTRFFTVVSLDDPTFQERSVEVILDGQDASDFKGYVNSVSVLFRKQRFSGAPMTGEVKFVDQQFAQSGNQLSFKYGRLNEASTEWLDYEYKPKWSFYGGVEWEGEWTKTSDSVLTLTPPVRRRTLEISVDEDNILKNNIKALAVQVKHQIYGKDILKEVVINYDKGDPLQADYTYIHEEGNLGYSYKVVWLFLDGREIHTDWIAKESPFIYAVYTKK